MWNYPLAPPQASNHAAPNDAIFGLITALTVFFTAVVLLMVIIFVIKYRRGSSANRDNIVHHSQKLEYLWSIPPLILGIIIFAISSKEFVSMRTPPKDAMEIFVIGKQWMWHIQHPNGVRENNELHVPLGKPVKLTMISQDVIHAFYVPAFRQQYHVIPGRYTTIWFTPTKEGRYPLFCNMYCGTQHSEMGGYVYVVKQTEYAQFLARGGNRKKDSVKTLADEGRELYTQLRCDNCHGPTDTERAPSLYGISGSNRKFADGSTGTATDDYLRESIIDPYKRITNGYDKAMPPDYKAQLTEEQIRNLIEYMKSLGTAPAATPKPIVMNTSTSSGGNR